MKKENLKILFMGTPNISAYVLEALINEGYKIEAVISQPDRPVGRKGIIEKVPTKVVAEKYEIPVFQPVKIRTDYDFVKELKPDVIITLAYGQIIPQGMLDIPPYGCLNLHGSLLPKYRGAAPIQYALINNDKVTGMTLMEMTAEMDAGRMYAKKEVIIDEEDNCTSLFNKMGVAAKELILESLPKYIDGELQGVEQDPSLVTICPQIKPEQEKIDLNLSTKEVFGLIRGLSDEPGAYLYSDNEKIKIYKSRILNDKIEGEIGEIIQANKNGLVLQLKDGQLSLLEIQKEGKKRMDYKSFINGNQNILHKILK
ncbi:MAG: methionyl-tRNA formyltransferase [Bacilli bacterium]|nr:methionyl-tRNA formyltransferase [Bacilli bacterium]